MLGEGSRKRNAEGGGAAFAFDSLRTPWKEDIVGLGRCDTGLGPPRTGSGVRTALGVGLGPDFDGGGGPL